MIPNKPVQMKKLLTAILLLMLTTAANAQQFPDNSLGSLKKLTKGNNTFTFETTNGKARVIIYSPEIVRIRIVKATFAEDFSYAVTANPQPVNIKLKEEKGVVQILTDSLQIVVSTDPVRFTFKSASGKMLNQDDPAFGTSWVGEEVTTFKKLQADEKFIGLGEKTGNLDRRGEGYSNWNSDKPGYSVNEDPLYSTFPFYIGIHHRVAYGIFFDNTFRSNFNFGASNNRYSSFGSDAGEMNYYFIGGNSVSRIIENYTFLTGKTPIPPIWALGFQQSRWSYYPDKEVLDLGRTFRDKKIPIDLLYLDIHYMDAYKIFTWHPQRFSRPSAMIKELKDIGIRTAVIVDPGIKVEKGYPAFEDGLKQNMFIKYPDGTNYTAQVWPGWCNFPDFTKPAARKWWGEKFSDYVNTGVEGFWNDMNEIASWGGGKTSSIVRFDWEGKGASYRQGKNVYGMLMARSTYEGTSKMMGKRPLILTRAAYAGAQRYTAIWTGDNVASDEHMLLGCRMVNSLGITGMAFSGVDVGGFMGDASEALFSRWLTIGSFTPFFRVHKHYDYKMSEPWSYGPITENISRNYISLRYRMLPYIYSAFYEANKTGMPVSRTLAIENTFDSVCWHYTYQNQYMFGPSLLVAPVESTKEATRVYLPKGTWFDFFTGKQYEGEQEILVDCPLDKLPVFAKGGSFIPLQTLIQSTSEKCSDTLFLHVYFGNDPSEYIYYEDDGLTYNYEKGESVIRKFLFNPLEKQILIDAPQGSFKSKFSKFELIMHGFNDLKSKIKLNGNIATLQDMKIDLLTSLSDKDALNTNSRKYIQETCRLMIDDISDKNIINW
jgi:alpha-glucosidase